MEIINKTLCKTTNAMGRVADFIVIAVKAIVTAVCRVADLIGAAVAAIIKWVVLSALALFAMVSAGLLWMSVPYFACMTMFGDDINSIWQVYAMFGIFGAWTILPKIVYDRLASRNKSPLDKFFEELNKRA